MASLAVAKSFVGLVLLGSIPLQAQADCNVRDYITIREIQQNGTSEIAFVLSTTEEEFKRVKKDFTGSGGYGIIWGSSSYAEARDKALKIAKAIKYDFKASQNDQYYLQEFSQDAMKGYIECINIEAQKPGLKLWYVGREGTGKKRVLVIKASWVGKNTLLPTARYDEKPRAEGGVILSAPASWAKAQIETIRAREDGVNDFFLEVKAGGEVGSIVVAKAPPVIKAASQRITSKKLMAARSFGPNPGCQQGSDSDDLLTTHEGGYFQLNSETLLESKSTQQSYLTVKYEFKPNSTVPNHIKAYIHQGTSACGRQQMAQGRLSAVEIYPVVE